MEHGGDIRCFIIDNHRPYHLANIHSNHSVVVFRDTTEEDYEGPSDGSDLSSGDDMSSSDEDDDDDDDDFDQQVRFK